MKMRLLVTVYSPIDAELLVSRLNDEGIDAVLENRHTLSVMPFWTVALGGLRVVVPEEHFEAARVLLEQLNSGAEALPEEEPEKCPHCGVPKVAERRVGFWDALRAFLFGIFGVPLPVGRLVKRCPWCERKSVKATR